MTNFRPDLIYVSELARRSEISEQTIYRFIRKGLYCEHLRGKTYIDISDFLHFVHEHYRFKRIKLTSGKRWTEDELNNPVGRSKTAIRLKKYRYNIEHEK